MMTVQVTRLGRENALGISYRDCPELALFGLLTRSGGGVLHFTDHVSRPSDRERHLQRRTHAGRRRET